MTGQGAEVELEGGAAALDESRLELAAVPRMLGRPQWHKQPAVCLLHMTRRLLHTCSRRQQPVLPQSVSASVARASDEWHAESSSKQQE